MKNTTEKRKKKFVLENRCKKSILFMIAIHISILNIKQNESFSTYLRKLKEIIIFMFLLRA